MKKEPSYDWNEETGKATYKIFYKDLTFTGEANCHPDDEDMKNRLMGLTIAEARATLAYLRHIKNNELQPQLKALKQLYFSMKHSKQFNSKSYEATMLFRQISMLMEDIKNVNIEISNVKEFLFQYLKEKELLHNTLREKRKGQK